MIRERQHPSFVLDSCGRIPVRFFHALIHIVGFKTFIAVLMRHLRQLIYAEPRGPPVGNGGTAARVLSANSYRVYVAGGAFGGSASSAASVTFSCTSPSLEA